MGCDLWVFVVTLIAVTVGGSPGTKETNLQENMINKPHKLGTDLVMASVESVLNEVHLLRTQVSLLQRQNSRVYTMVKRQGRSCGNNKSSSRCPPDFPHHRHGSCYRMEAEKLSWQDARRRCRTWGADLVAIETEAEYHHLLNIIKQTQSLEHCDMWTGGVDNGSGVWKWNSTSEALTDASWHPGEPNSRHHNKCIWLDWYFGWAWNDHSCGERACYICEAIRSK